MPDQDEDWLSPEYELIDFGAGRKLERFGRVVLDRVCPAADSARPRNAAWWSPMDARLPQGLQGSRSGQSSDLADAGPFCFAKLNEQGKVQTQVGEWPEDWRCCWGNTVFQLKLTPFGHVGVFPEQHQNWRMIQDWITRRVTLGLETRVLNLFAYTGGSTLAAAFAGAQVAHVDASAPAVTWARKNAQASHGDELPIRWLVEDSRKFVEREIRRSRQYDLVILDPPSFGNGPKGQRWEITKHVYPLLEDCWRLLVNAAASTEAKLLLTAHCHDPAVEQLRRFVSKALREVAPEISLGNLHIDAKRLVITDRSQRDLDAGFVVDATVPH